MYDGELDTTVWTTANNSLVGAIERTENVMGQPAICLYVLAFVNALLDEFENILSGDMV
jgi:hypothetical protein